MARSTGCVSREALLREFDMYEACGEGFAEPTQYVRQMLPVTLADGAPGEAWTYIYNWPVAKLSGSSRGGSGEVASPIIPGRARREPGIHALQYASGTMGPVLPFERPGD